MSAVNCKKFASFVIKALQDTGNQEKFDTKIQECYKASKIQYAATILIDSIKLALLMNMTGKNSSQCY